MEWYGCERNITNAELCPFLSPIGEAPSKPPEPASRREIRDLKADVDHIESGFNGLKKMAHTHSKGRTPYSKYSLE